MAWIRAKNIAKRISDLRDGTGWSQADLGERVGRVWQTVSDWERGRRPPPDKLLVRLAREHGWPVEIFAEDGPMPSSVVNPPVNKLNREGAGSGVDANATTAKGKQDGTGQELTDTEKIKATLKELLQAASEDESSNRVLRLILELKESLEKGEVGTVLPPFRG